MGAWILIERELRAMCRQAPTFWIRVVSGAIVTTALILILANPVIGGPQLGARIFSVLHFMLLATTLAVGPFITADCIAQEKREGTLGLLFLAPLTSREIILSKLSISAVRALSMLIAALPIAVFPLIWGGVTGAQAVSALISQVFAMSIALSAGIVASTKYREWLQAAVWAELYAFGIVIFFFLAGRLLFQLRLPHLFTYFMSAISIMVVVQTVRYGSAQLKRRWEKDESTFTPPRWIRAFSDGLVFSSLLHWDTRKARSRNPIAWLQEYSWTARLSKWGWFLFVGIWEFFGVFGGALRGSDGGLQFALATVVVLGIALSSSNSFRRERASGAMELLLVTPVPEWKLVGGRLWGVWIHFFPAVCIQAFLWIASEPLMKNRSELAVVLISSYLFVPMVGLYLSMKPWNVLVTWGTVFVLGALLPYYVSSLLPLPLAARAGFAATIQSILGITSLFLLYRMLRMRTYCFQ